MKKLFMLVIIALLGLPGCGFKEKQGKTESHKAINNMLKQKVEEFATFKLTTDLSVLSEKEREMLPLLLGAAKIMDDIFWQEAYGDKGALFESNTDEYVKKILEINYGPWERLNNNKPFLKGFGAKPAGANFYPHDMAKEEFEAWDEPLKLSLYTIIRRDGEGKLTAIPYHEFFKRQISEAAGLIRQAAGLAEDKGLKVYLEKRAAALLTDDYYDSDIAWLDMQNNTIEFIIGPIENYEDQLFGYKAAHESFILIKDKDWSKKLEKYTAVLPTLQKSLPCELKYKDETPGIDTDINVYDAIYYAGDCNAGSKTIAINLPNDEKVREIKGSRKLQLKNSMQAKFDKILIPISRLLIAKEQQKYVKFDAFFENTMFHEVAHGLGLGNTSDKSSTVRGALKNTYSAIEEGKADILGLWCIYKLNEMGEFTDKDMMDNFVTFMAGIFRSVRFGAASAHGKANMVRFYYFQEKGAFERDDATGTYRVNYGKMKDAMLSLSEMILKIQGDGDFEAAKRLLQEKGAIRGQLQKDLDRITQAGIPRDIVFEQGAEVLGLQ
ncbi:MAG: Zn-dependent hydrolase [Chlorobi bacterium]|nr:Zn-dependent hydrolase [Chlorobiota bacterium]